MPDIFSQEDNPAACWESPALRPLQDVFVTFGGVVCKLKAANPIKHPPPLKKTGKKKKTDPDADVHTCVNIRVHKTHLGNGDGFC